MSIKLKRNKKGITRSININVSYVRSEISLILRDSSQIIVNDVNKTIGIASKIAAHVTFRLLSSDAAKIIITAIIVLMIKAILNKTTLNKLY